MKGREVMGRADFCRCDACVALQPWREHGRRQRLTAEQRAAFEARLAKVHVAKLRAAREGLS